MASVTLAESAKLAQNELVAGVIENVITVNQMFEVLPFDGIEGNALAYNRENALGDVMVAGVDDTVTASNPATFTPVTSSLTTIIGDAEVNGLIAATRSSDGNNQTAIQIASKSKSCGRKYQDLFINGDANTADEFDGLINLVAAGQKLTPTNAQELSFDLMDELIDLVTDKDGAVDYLAVHGRSRRLYRALLRNQPGAGLNETMELPSGNVVPTYGGVPLFRNDFIPVNVSQGTGPVANTSFVFAGTFDDGSRQHGLAGLTASSQAGIQVEDVGIMEAKDNHKWRVKWYAGLAVFSEKGLAMAEGIKSTIS